MRGQFAGSGQGREPSGHQTQCILDWALSSLVLARASSGLECQKSGAERKMEWKEKRKGRGADCFGVAREGGLHDQEYGRRGARSASVL